MTQIISMSLDEKTLKEVDALQHELGFSGRSETLRQCIRLFSNDHQQSKKLRGEIDGVLLVVHPDEHTENISNTRHAYQHIIKTHIHNHLENHTCLELFVVHGNAETIQKFARTLQASPKVNLVKLLVV